MEDQVIRDAITKRIAEDALLGKLRALPDYQSEWPKHSKLVADIWTGVAREILPRGNRGQGDSTLRISKSIGEIKAVPDEHNELPPELAEGDRFAHFILKQRIGEGAHGVVYEATDTRNGESRALKLLKHASSASTELIRRFMRESEAASKAIHPYICRIYEAGVHDRIPYIAMALVDGCTLESLIIALRSKQPRRIAPQSSAARPANSSSMKQTEQLRSTTSRITLFEKISLGLHAIHAAGIVHRDIKPANIMISSNGNPVIMDFGLARNENLRTITQTGDLLGTPAYMSPEQLTFSAIKLDRRTDIWSLGAMLYECTTLQRPFDAVTRTQLYHYILSKEPLDPRRINKDICADLATLIGVALEKDRDRRIPTAALFADELRKVAQDVPISVRPPSTATKVRRWAKRNRGAALGIAAAVAILLIGATSSTLLWLKSSHNLTEWERLADGRRLEDLTASAKDVLWPAVPRKIPGIRKWISEGEALIARLPEHRAALQRTRAHALPFDSHSQAADRKHYADWHARIETIQAILSRPRKIDDSSEASTRVDLESELKVLLRAVAERRTWRFSDPGDQLRHDKLTDLVLGLIALSAKHEKYSTTIALAERQQNMAISLAHRLGGIDAHAWDTCLASLGEQDSPYRGLEIGRIAGLVPLGWDRDSKLWEFWHVASGGPPRWDGRPLGPGKAMLEADRGGIVLALIPSHSFAMGAATFLNKATKATIDPDAQENEGPVHSVSLAPFFASKWEVTQGQWMNLWGQNPSYYAPESDAAPVTLKHPVTDVEWSQCRESCERWDLRLPTESQWEAMCRAGTTTRFCSGPEAESLVGFANIADQSAKTIDAGLSWAARFDDGFAVHSPVGAMRPNLFGLHNMHGNVWEWCRDRMFLYQEFIPADGNGLRGPNDKSRVGVVRGGSYFDPAVKCRSSFRMAWPRENSSPTLGFRPVYEIPPSAEN